MQTGGHAGLVCFCGKRIQEDLLNYKTMLTYKEWIKYASDKLQIAITSWPTIGRIQLILDKEGGSPLNFLIKHFLRSKPQNQFNDVEDQRIVRAL